MYVFYYASMLRCWHLIWILVRTDHPCLGVGCHIEHPGHTWKLRFISFGTVSPGFKAKTRCSSYVCPGSSCHTYGQNVSTEYQCLYYNVSYYNNLSQVRKGLSSGMDPILPQAVDRGFRTPRRNLHQSTPHHLSSKSQQQHAKSMASVST